MIMSRLVPNAIGQHIPTLAEIRHHRPARRRRPAERPLLLTTISSGLRAYKLRGLRWVDVDLAKAELHGVDVPTDT